MTDFNTTEYENTKYEAFKRGTSTQKVFGTIEKTADVKNNDRLIIIHNISVDCVVHSIKVTNGAMEAFTGVKLVALKPCSKNIIQQNKKDFSFVDNISFATANSNLDIFPQKYKGTSLKQILGIKSRDVSSVDLALVSSAVGSATGTIYIEAEFSSPF